MSRVVLNGPGGDECLWGSHQYCAEDLRAGNLKLLWDCLQRDALAGGSRNALFWFLRHGAFALLPVSAQVRAIRTLRRWQGTLLPASRTRSWLAAALREEGAAALEAELGASLLPDGRTRLLAATRQGWVDAAGVTELYRRYQTGSEGGWPQWYLWTLAACDTFVTSVTEATPAT